MERLISHELVKWKNREDRKPLILKGVRQCGKTYILKKFAKENYADTAYFNFEASHALSGLFEQDIDPKRIITELGILTGRKLNPGSTLIIFDEIQFCNRALASLKYFHEQAPEYHIAGAGSLLGITLSRPLSFPVGKVDFITLRPLSFYEFVLASGGKMLLDYTAGIGADRQIPKIYADKMETFLKTYLVTGGMPEAAAKWIETNDISEVTRIQDMILSSYQLDFAKHAPAHDFPRISLIWQSIPAQLAKENGKFIYGHVKNGARAREFEDAMQYLIQAGMVYKICKIEKPAFPLMSYADGSYFKLYTADAGLLGRMSNLPPDAVFSNSKLFVEFKGALTENYVLNELINIDGDIPYYWKSGNTAEVDFIKQFSDKIIPIEVKSSVNVKSRSLGVYREKYKCGIAVRTSMQNYKLDRSLVNIPLYMLWNFKNIINSAAQNGRDMAEDSVK